MVASCAPSPAISLCVSPHVCNMSHPAGHLAFTPALPLSVPSASAMSSPVPRMIAAPRSRGRPRKAVSAAPARRRRAPSAPAAAVAASSGGGGGGAKRSGKGAGKAGKRGTKSAQQEDIPAGIVESVGALLEAVGVGKGADVEGAVERIVGEGVVEGERIVGKVVGQDGVDIGTEGLLDGESSSGRRKRKTKSAPPRARAATGGKSGATTASATTSSGTAAAGTGSKAETGKRKRKTATGGRRTSEEVGAGDGDSVIGGTIGALRGAERGPDGGGGGGPATGGAVGKKNVPSLTSDNTVRWYLQLIGAEHLLRAEDEVELGRAIKDLMHWERARAELTESMGRPPSDVEWASYLDMEVEEFLPLLIDARRAKDRMIVANLRLVVSIAKKYMHRGMPLSDMIQEGTLGLVRAVEKFDGDRGFKFSTYATWWVKQAVTRSIADQSRTIRLPVHLYDTISAIRKATKQLSAQLGRPPTEDEIAAHVGIPLEKLHLTRVRMQSTVPIDSPLTTQDETLTLADVIESPDETPEDRVDNSLLRDDLEHVINSLTPRERDVVRMRYGLDDGRTKTLEEIGTVFSVTKERVRQIESKALRKLRHPYRSAVLRDYSAAGSSGGDKESMLPRSVGR